MRKKVLVIAGILALTLLLGGIYMISRGDRYVAEKSADVNSGTYSAPSKEDIERTEKNKDEIAREQRNQNDAVTSSDNTAKKSVKPVITYVGIYGQAVEIAGYVDVFEEGGVCTATFTLGAKTITKSVAAVRDATSVNCPSMSVPVADFTPKGTYVADLQYTSASANGKAESKQVSIP